MFWMPKPIKMCACERKSFYSHNKLEWILLLLFGQLNAANFHCANEQASNIIFKEWIKNKYENANCDDI